MPIRRSTPLDDEWVESHMCSVDLRLHILSQVPFFCGLPQGDLAKINGQFIERGYEPHQTIYYTGDPARRLYVVADGRVKLIHHTLEGKDVTLDFLQPGELFGTLGLETEDAYRETAQAQTHACALSIGRQEFRGLLNRYASMALKVIDVTAERLRDSQEMVSQLSAHSVEQRVAFILPRLAEKLGEERPIGRLIQLPLSRRDLAEMAGTSPESVSRVVSQFRDQGLIEAGRRWVAIRDAEALQAVKAGTGPS